MRARARERFPLLDLASDSPLGVTAPSGPLHIHYQAETATQYHFCDTQPISDLFGRSRGAAATGSQLPRVKRPVASSRLRHGRIVGRTGGRHRPSRGAGSSSQSLRPAPSCRGPPWRWWLVPSMPQVSPIPTGSQDHHAGQRSMRYWAPPSTYRRRHGSPGTRPRSPLAVNQASSSARSVRSRPAWRGSLARFCSSSGSARRS